MLPQMIPKMVPNLIHRQLRTRAIGLRISSAFLILSALGLASDLFVGRPFLALGDALNLIAAAASLLLTRSSAEREFVWQPLYFGVWLGTMPLIGMTGGVYSPFLIGILVFQLLAGVIIQSRFKPSQVGAFVFFNFILWSAATPLLHLYPAPTIPTQRLFIQNLLFVGSAVRIILGILSAGQEKQADSEAKITEISTLVRTKSHDLAQPVQVITLSVSYLKRMSAQGKFTPELVNMFLGNISDSAQRLTTMIASLSDANSRIQGEARPDRAARIAGKERS